MELFCSLIHYYCVFVVSTAIPGQIGPILGFTAVYRWTPTLILKNLNDPYFRCLSPLDLIAKTTEIFTYHNLAPTFTGADYTCSDKAQAAAVNKIDFEKVKNLNYKK